MTISQRGVSGDFPPTHTVETRLALIEQALNDLLTETKKLQQWREEIRATVQETAASVHMVARDCAQLLRAVDDAEKKHLRHEARIRELEDWRTGLVAKLSVIVVVASAIAGIAADWIAGLIRGKP